MIIDGINISDYYASFPYFDLNCFMHIDQSTHNLKATNSKETMTDQNEYLLSITNAFDLTQNRMMSYQ